MTKDYSPGRRSFLNWFLGGSLVAWLVTIFYPLLKYLSPRADTEAEVTSAKVAQVMEFPPDSGKIVKFGSKPALLVRKKDGSFRAFYAKCSHLDCSVQYRSDMQRIWCACHNGQYDLNGINVAGPPPRPLESLDVHVKGEDVYVARKV